MSLSFGDSVPAVSMLFFESTLGLYIFGKKKRPASTGKNKKISFVMEQLKLYTVAARICMSLYCRVTAKS